MLSRVFLEEGRGRLRALWRLVAQFVTFVVATALLSGLLAVVFALVRPVGTGFGGSVQAATESPAFFFLGPLASLLAIFLSVWLSGRFLDHRPLADFGFHLDGGWWLDLFFGMLLGALLMTAIFFAELALGWVSVAGAFESVEPGLPFALAVLIPTTVFIGVGIYEETLSRGYQLRNIAEGLNYPAFGPRTAVVAAWVLTSVVFGLLHVFNPNASFISTTNIALAGLLLGIGYVLTGELAIPIGLHITWNFFQGNVYGFPVSGGRTIGATFLNTRQGGPELWTGGPFGPEAGLVGIGAMISGSLLIALYVRLRTGKVAIHTPIAQAPSPDHQTTH